MKTRLLGLLILSLSMLIACSDDISSLEEHEMNTLTEESMERMTVNTRGSDQEKISGQLSFNAFNGDMDWRTFSINAQKDAAGNVKGNYTRIRRVDGNANNAFTNQGEVVCFDIDGNYASVILKEEIDGVDEYFFMNIYDGGNGIGADSMTQNLNFNPENIPIEILCDGSFRVGRMVQGQAGNVKFH